jgi:hypothetical protein
MTIHFEDQAEFHALFLDPDALFLDMDKGRQYIAGSNESNYIH